MWILVSNRKVPADILPQPRGVEDRNMWVVINSGAPVCSVGAFVSREHLTFEEIRRGLDIGDIRCGAVLEIHVQMWRHNDQMRHHAILVPSIGIERPECGLLPNM